MGVVCRSRRRRGLPRPRAGAGGRDLLVARYRTTAELPTHPAHFGHEKLVGAKAWQMLCRRSREQAGNRRSYILPQYPGVVGKTGRHRVGSVGQSPIT